MATPPEDLYASCAGTVYAASACTYVIAGGFFAARMASKRIQRQSPDASDLFLLFGVFCAFGVASINIWMTTVGLGKHFALVEKEDPSLSNVILILKVFIPDEVFYDCGIATVKISILLLYRSIFLGRGFNIATWVLMGVVVAWCLGNLLPSIFSCRPVSGFWDITMDPPPTCINKVVLYITGSTLNIATDIAILCLPIGKIMELQLSRRNKIGVIAVFLLGGLVCIVSIYRFTVLLRANSPDLTWEFTRVVNWSAAELATAVASACLPLMRPLLFKCLPRSILGPSGETRANHTATIGTAGAKQKTFHGIGRGTEASFGMNSEFEFERLPEDQSDDHVTGWCESEGKDGDSNNKHDGITVTRTFEMTSMASDRDRSGGGQAADPFP